MFYVYHGYYGPDHFDSSDGPLYKLSSFKTISELEEFKEEFDEVVNSIPCSNIIFRIIEGKERKMKPVQVVTKWIME